MGVVLVNKDIRIDLSFGGWGDGNHPSTVLCLDELRRHKPGTLLDYGSGSGVISVYALSLGWDVLAVDIDPKAREASKLNAEANGFDLEVVETVPDDRDFSLVIGNVGPGPEAAKAGRYLDRFSTLFFSGSNWFTVAPISCRYFNHRITGCFDIEDWVALRLEIIL